MDSKINVGADKKKIEQSNFFTVREFSCTQHLTQNRYLNMLFRVAEFLIFLLSLESYKKGIVIKTTPYYSFLIELFE